MRTHLTRPVLAIAVLIAVTAAPALAQPPGTVRGRVVDETGAPVRDAQATFQAEGSQTTRQTKTDGKGEFLIVGIDSARYKVTVSKDGFLDDIVTVQLAQQKNPLLEFKLRVPKATTAAGGTTVVSEGPAIPVAAAVAVTDPKETAALQTLARTAIDALNGGRNDEAIAAFTQIVAKVPACSDCYVNLGVAHVNKKEYPQAEAAFKRATEIKADHAEAYERLASVYSAQKKFELAAEASGIAAKLSGAAPAAPGVPGAAVGGGGGNFTALYNQGVALFNGGKFAEAKTAFEGAVKANPKMAMAHYHLGIAAVNLGDFALAVRELETYLQLEPNGEKAAEVKASLPALKGMVKK